MSQTYLLFDFGTDEEKAQQARHKLEGWKQAFRLDKKLLYKVERAEAEPKAGSSVPAAEPEESAAPAKSGKPKAKPAPKSKQKSAAAEAEKGAKDAKDAPAGAEPANGKVHLLVRLYFSGHEKLTEQRWVGRIPAEEPFKGASPRIVHEGEPQFEEVVSQFDSLE